MARNNRPRRDTSAKLDADGCDPEGAVDREIRELIERNHRDAIARVLRRREAEANND